LFIRRNCLLFTREGGAGWIGRYGSKVLKSFLGWFNVIMNERGLKWVRGQL
jgi:hypothetical protein